MRTSGFDPQEGPAGVSAEDGLEVRLDEPEERAFVTGGDDAWGGRPPRPGGRRSPGPGATVAEGLRDEVVTAFNERDLDGLLSLCHPEVECPDLHGDGRSALAEEFTSLWEWVPELCLTGGYLDDEPCAVAWLPDEGRWLAIAVVRLEVAGEGLCLVGLLDDDDVLAMVDTWTPADTAPGGGPEE